MTIECVTLTTNHLFPGNPISEQHFLRHRAIVERQAWEVPQYRGMEYDEYDNPASIYLIWRDENLMARGVSRLYPTDRPFMLSEKFSHMVSSGIPSGPDVLEGSRFCVDHTLPVKTRKRICKELILAYLEYSLDKNIKRIVGIMYPAYWKSLFIRNGWQPVWLGEQQLTPDGKKSRAGFVNVNHEILQELKERTQINKSVLSYGLDSSNRINVAA